MATLLETRRWVGAALPRREDLRFVRGRGEYLDDLEFRDGLHVVPLRSPLAHGRIVRIDVSRAAGMPGVAAVITGDDLRGDMPTLPSSLPPPFDRLGGHPIAVDKVRYAGEPVALVLARDPYRAEDALAGIQVDYDPLDPVVDPLTAGRPGTALVHDGLPSNVVWSRTFSYGDVTATFARTDHVVRRRLHLPRFTSSPLETAAVAAAYDARTRSFLVTSNLQSPERFRRRIAGALRVDPEQLHFLCPDIGGGFGIKFHYPWAVMLCWLARRVALPVKWVEDRTGHLLASHHGNEVWYDAELAVGRDGTIHGYRTSAVHDEGAYLEREPKGAVNQLRHATSLYRFQSVELRFSAVLTNKCPTGPNRSYGKVQQNYLIDRLVDEAARELGFDPLELRRRNLVGPDEMPYRTPAGALYDGGDYPRLVRRAEERFGYEAFRSEQAAARRRGRFIGVGLALGIEASPSNAALQDLVNPGAGVSGDSEAASVKLRHDGRVTAAMGSVPQGQGHESTAAQIVADELGLTPDEVEVTRGYDSRRDPSTPYSGTHASRFAIMAGGALLGAAAQLRSKILRFAAELLETPEGVLRLEGGGVEDPITGRRLSFAELARRADLDVESLPDGMQPGLEARFVYRAPFGPAQDSPRGNFSLTYASCAAFVAVEVDVETGRVRPLRVVCVHDCGREINPMIVEGQVHGAIAHQVGAALFETLAYDASGQLLTSTFKDYLTPTALDLPSFEVESAETPSLFAALGARGGGEGSGAPMVAAVNAVSDALEPFGIVLEEGYVAPDRLLSLIRAARSDGAGRTGAGGGAGASGD